MRPPAYGHVAPMVTIGRHLVVAGDTEDKPEIAARVAWAGAGINLRTGSPTADAIGDAARRILAEPRFRFAAKRLADEFGRTTPLPSITPALQDAVTSSRSGAAAAAR